MKLADELRRVQAAEDLFALFGIDFDPRTLRVHRLHILKRFGTEVTELDACVPPLDDDERWRLYAEALQRAHDFYQAGAPTGTHAFSGVRGRLARIGIERSKRRF